MICQHYRRGVQTGYNPKPYIWVSYVQKTAPYIAYLYRLCISDRVHRLPDVSPSLGKVQQRSCRQTPAQRTLMPESSLISVLFLSSFFARSYTALCSTFVELMAAIGELESLCKDRRFDQNSSKLGSSVWLQAPSQLLFKCTTSISGPWGQEK
jgi:hypothetical protein